MIERPISKLEDLMSKIRPYIENETPIEVTLDKNTLIGLHETLLAAKIVKERLSSIEKFTEKEVKEIPDVMLDCASYADDVVYGLIAILERKGVV